MLILPVLVIAQKPKVMNYQEVDHKLLHFGFSLGISTMDFSIERDDNYFARDSIIADLGKWQPGFNVHIVSELQLTHNLALRCLPGLTFGQRDIYFVKSNQTGQQYEKTSLESNFIDFPLLLKYKSTRVNNYRAYLLLGGSARYDLAARKDFEEDGDDKIKLKAFDYYVDFGAGLDSYLQYFKFSTELKLSVGFRDVMSHKGRIGHEQYAASIDRLGSFIITLDFNFE